MSFDVSNKAFEEAFGSHEKKGAITNDFLGQLKEYLAGKNFESAKALHSWLEKGGTLSAFSCRVDMLKGMMAGLRRHRTPYILVKNPDGGVGFLIRSSDTELVKKITKHALKEKARFCAVTTGEEAGNLYLKSKEKDKNMLQICGLSEEEAIYLEEECNAALPGEVIGVDQMEDGTYMVSCHGKTAVEGKKRRKSFGVALSESLMAMNGDVSDKMKKRAQNEAMYREAKAAGFPDRNGAYDEAVWIVGDGERFVMVTSEGFELGHAIEEGADVLLETDLAVGRGDARFESRLNTALSHVLRKVCLYSEEEVIEHFRTKRSYLQDQTIIGQEQLLMLADAIIAGKVKKDNITHLSGKWEHKFRHYQSEMRRLMIGVRDGKIPKGYTKEDIISLRKVASVFGLDLMVLTPAIEKLANLDVYAKDAGKNKVTNIENTIAKYRIQQEKEKVAGKTREGYDRG